MKLKQLLRDCSFTQVKGSLEVSVTNICYHTSNIEKDCVFVCMKGFRFDGHEFMEQAFQLGAKAFIVEELPIVTLPNGVPIILVENTRKTLAYMSAAFFNYPAKKLKMIGITGTKGKTTTTYMIRSILEQNNIKTCLIGTIETVIEEQIYTAENTTPESYVLQSYLHEAVLAGCECAVMEVSSQGLKLDRVAGIEFDCAVFMNLSRDHIGTNEHKDFQEYMDCKGTLFSQTKVGIFNLDDLHAKDMMKGCKGAIETFAMNQNADLRAVQYERSRRIGFLGGTFDVLGWYDFHVSLNFPGMFNCYNALAAISVAKHFGLKGVQISYALKNVTVKGRMELVPLSQKYTVLIDYAHNAMSLQSILQTLKEYHPYRLVCLFGCGGNRSKERRFEMGEVASRYADLSVITEDNPRFEDSFDIINDILLGVKKEAGDYIVIPNRKEAIRYCLLHANANDIIVLAGKGHETYQEIQGVKHPMDERELIREICKEESI